MFQGEEEESDMSAPEIVTHHRGGHRRPQPRRLQVPFDLMPHHKGHRTAHRGTSEHFSEAALRMGHPQHEDEEDSAASEADLLCSEVLSETQDEGSDVGSDELYARRHYRMPQVCNVDTFLVLACKLDAGQLSLHTVSHVCGTIALHYGVF